MNLRDIADAALEIPIVPSFTKLGYVARKRLDDWSSVDGYDMSGRVVVVTGATSGLGRWAAEQFASMGATVVVIGRGQDRSASVAGEITASTGNDRVSHAACDLCDLDQVARLAEHLMSDHDRLDVLVHNAGALSAERTV